MKHLVINLIPSVIEGTLFENNSFKKEICKKTLLSFLKENPVYYASCSQDLLEDGSVCEFSEFITKDKTKKFVIRKQDIKEEWFVEI